MLDQYPIGKRLRLPKLGSWPETVHVFERRDVYALAAAEAAGRPLLLRGDPGTGKSQLARAAAVATKRLFLSVVVNAQTTCQDLQWLFDAVARLGEAQLLAHADDAASRDRLEPKNFLSPGPLWWAFDWTSAHKQWRACAHPPEQAPIRPRGWQPKRGSVLLIDEIDKADADLPNGLLETLGNGDFAVPYANITARQSKEEDCPTPLVVITTNEERELPDAFLRRCMVLALHLPESDAALIHFLCERGSIHFPKTSYPTVRSQAAKLLLKDRKAALSQGLPPPGQAEYLDLLRALARLATDEATQLELLEEISSFALQKSAFHRS